MALRHCADQGVSLIRKQHQKGICLVRDGEVLAACVYEEFNGANIFVHCCGTAGKPWLNRDFLHWSFHYPFNQLGAKRLSCWVEANNLASRRFVEHLGFSLEATLQGAGRSGDALIYRMFREDCRYVPQEAPGRHDLQEGQQEPVRSAGR